MMTPDPDPPRWEMLTTAAESWRAIWMTPCSSSLKATDDAVVAGVAAVGLLVEVDGSADAVSSASRDATPTVTPTPAPRIRPSTSALAVLFMEISEAGCPAADLAVMAQR
jgi:hypothetical protein